ncbi:MAG: hypothetical protein V2I34_09525 [Bacteroidales bacterium]|nr:hypothetical protein [Bacteroidales bacterium]
MKKAFVFFSLIVFCLSLYAQDGERELIDKYCSLLVNDLLQRAEGYLKDDTWESPEEGGLIKNTLIGLPASYSFEMARADVRRMVKNHPEMTVATRWQPGYDSFYHVILELPDRLAGIIYYSKKVNTMKVTVGRMEKTD